MNIKYLPDALNDLENVFKYVYQDNVNQAVNTILQIQDAIDYLKDNPSIGRIGIVAGTRELVLLKLPFTIPYRVREGTIEILAVMHQSRRWPDSSDCTE